MWQTSGFSRAIVRTAFLTRLQEARPFGLREWRLEASRWAADAEHWSQPELEAALEELLRADRRLKHTTVAGAAEILQEALLTMAGQAAEAA